MYFNFLNLYFLQNKLNLFNLENISILYFYGDIVKYVHLNFHIKIDVFYDCPLAVMGFFLSPQVKFDAEDDCREKTLRFSADDACMDLTQSHTVNVIDFTRGDMYPQSGHLKKAEMTSHQQPSEALRSSNHKGMETPNLQKKFTSELN